MKTFVINLDRSTDRLAEFEARHAHLDGVTRFSAFDGRLLSKDELTADGIIAGDPPYTMGTVGSFLSHTALWKLAAESGEPVTVVEDDAVLSRHFRSKSRDLIASTGDDWDFIAWGWNFDAYLWVDLIPGVSRAVITTFQDEMRKSLDAFQSADHDNRLVRVLHFFGILCYTVSPKGAKALLDYCLPLRPLMIDFPGFGVQIENRTLDGMMNGVYPDLKAFISIPPLAVSENEQAKSVNIHG